ncbi:hypothetical protein ABPG73_008308 [Tetrahymena malaccensis]
MDHIANQQIQTCQKHANNQISFLRVNQLANQSGAQIFYCLDCVEDDLDFKALDYILIKQIIQQPQTEILKKWPPVNDYSILKKLQQQYQNFDSSKSVVQMITSYFNQLKQEIVIKIDNIQKKTINYALEIPFGKEQILQRYKQISQIDELKQILLEGQQQPFNVLNDQCKAFLSKIDSQKENNTQQLQNILNQCSKMELQVDFDIPNQIKTQITTLLENISFFPSQNSELNQNNINYNNNNLERIMELVSNKSNFCTTQFLDSFRKNLEKLNPFLEKMQFEYLCLFMIYLAKVIRTYVIQLEPINWFPSQSRQSNPILVLQIQLLQYICPTNLLSLKIFSNFVLISLTASQNAFENIFLLNPTQIVFSRSF